MLVEVLVELVKRVVQGAVRVPAPTPMANTPTVRHFLRTALLSSTMMHGLIVPPGRSNLPSEACANMSPAIRPDRPELDVPAVLASVGLNRADAARSKFRCCPLL